MEFPRFTAKIDPGKIIKEGFLRFASDELSNILKFPPVP